MFIIGDKVEKLGSKTDGNTGRKGEVVEIDSKPGEIVRFRVRLLYERNGDYIRNGAGGHNAPKNGIRTWNQGKFLKKIEFYPATVN